jgi:hypothetical protein
MQEAGDGPSEAGTLISVEPREVWPSEASGFTPWLASEDNLDLLGETLGLNRPLKNSSGTNRRLYAEEFGGRVLT